MSIIRNILGAVIIFFDWLFTPKSAKRDSESQAAIQAKLEGLTLYQYNACPFCVKVRRAMKREGISIEIKNTNIDRTAREELLAGGGKTMVPCLRMQEDGKESWMYESSDIIAYLKKRIAA